MSLESNPQEPDAPNKHRAGRNSRNKPTNLGFPRGFSEAAFPDAYKGIAKVTPEDVAASSRRTRIGHALGTFIGKPIASFAKGDLDEKLVDSAFTSEMPRAWTETYSAKEYIGRDDEHIPPENRELRKLQKAFDRPDREVRDLQEAFNLPAQEPPYGQGNPGQQPPTTPEQPKQ